MNISSCLGRMETILSQTSDSVLSGQSITAWQADLQARCNPTQINKISETDHGKTRCIYRPR